MQLSDRVLTQQALCSFPSTGLGLKGRGDPVFFLSVPERLQLKGTSQRLAIRLHGQSLVPLAFHTWGNLLRR